MRSLFIQMKARALVPFLQISVRGRHPPCEPAAAGHCGSLQLPGWLAGGAAPADAVGSPLHWPATSRLLAAAADRKSPRPQQKQQQVMQNLHTAAAVK